MELGAGERKLWMRVIERAVYDVLALPEGQYKHVLTFSKYTPTEEERADAWHFLFESELFCDVCRHLNFAPDEARAGVRRLLEEGYSPDVLRKGRSRASIESR